MGALTKQAENNKRKQKQVTAVTTILGFHQVPRGYNTMTDGGQIMRFKLQILMRFFCITDHHVR